MCIMTVLYQRVPDFPIVIAANRDEFYDRPACEPQLLQDAPKIWGGRDLRAGGTWLGFNEYGVVVGLTNRRMQDDQETDPSRCSRGLLCLAALKFRHAAEVTTFLAAEAPERYNPFNLLVLDTKSAFWTAYDGKPETQKLGPGLHILANQNLNDCTARRVRRARQLLSGTGAPNFQALFPHLERFCRDHEHGVEDRETICMHRHNKKYGTVSSTILAVSRDIESSIYRYADRHPCLQHYDDYSSLLST